ncbi:hypothetical protein JCM11641_005300 [Rhodosporidiobolus odoratus]
MTSPPQRIFPPPPMNPLPSYLRCEPGSKEISKRKLVLFFDGTGNAFGRHLTNIVTLFSLSSEDPSKQLLYYQTGIGTTISTHESPFMPSKMLQNIGMVIDAAIAWSLADHINKGYQFLMNRTSFRFREYWKGPTDANAFSSFLRATPLRRLHAGRPGASVRLLRQGRHAHGFMQIFLFGFSRGAFTARALAGMLQQVGLLPAGNEESIPLAYSIFKKTSSQLTPTETLAAGFKRTFSREVRVHFVGVFDTVSSVGALWPRTLPFAGGSTFIKNFRQALSLDECRARYAEQVWIPESATSSTSSSPSTPAPLDPTSCTDIREVWFSGAHSNVGGGEFPYDGDIAPSLSHLPLRWMLREALEKGLELDSAAVASSPLFSPFWAEARRALGKGDKADPALIAYLHTVKSVIPDVNEQVAACVFIASMPSPLSTADALAPRANHVSFAIEKRPKEVREKMGFKARWKEWWHRYRQRIVTLGWWALEVSPTPKVTWDAEGNSRRWSLLANFGRGRILPRSPSLHFSVRERMSASPSAFGPGNNENVPEGSAYHFEARFRGREGMGSVKWME